jgi:hypothetical protein
MQRQIDLLQSRYDLANLPIDGVMMSGAKGCAGRCAGKAANRRHLEQFGGDVAGPDTRPSLIAGRLHAAAACQAGDPRAGVPSTANRPDPGVKRDLRRFDVNFDLADHVTPEFPPPVFLTTHPELGDVSRGRLLTIKNFYEVMNGLITLVQREGLRLLLTPFPQEEFNQTEDRKVAEPSLGVTCLDCHANFNTNAAFHLTPDVRPQAKRFRLDTTSCAACSISTSMPRCARRGLHRVRTAHGLFQRRPRQRGAQGRASAQSARPSGVGGAYAEHHPLSARAKARSCRPARSWDSYTERRMRAA